MPTEQSPKDRPLGLAARARPRGVVLLVVLTAVGASRGLAGPASRPATTAPAVSEQTSPAKPEDSPPGLPDRCGLCLEETRSRLGSIALGAVDALCLSCHDGRLARREPHPIGRVFTRKDLVLPPTWPLADGRLSCATCHDVDKLCRARRGPSDNPTWLRGFRRSAPLEFCEHCHIASRDHQRHNPHLMIGADGQVNETSCWFCHTEVAPRRDGVIRTHEPALLGSELVLCIGCHPRHVDYFEPGHLGAKMDLKTRQQLGTPSRHVTSQPAGIQDNQLPLAEGHGIVCSTCHNPHQAGVFPAASLLGAGALYFDVTVNGLTKPDSYRGLGKELCYYCHGQ